jgi:hypothetical protein
LFEEHFVKLYTNNRPRDPRTVARIENANDANEENNMRPFWLRALKSLSPLRWVSSRSAFSLVDRFVEAI